MSIQCNGCGMVRGEHSTLAACPGCAQCRPCKACGGSHEIEGPIRAPRDVLRGHTLDDCLRCNATGIEPKEKGKPTSTKPVCTFWCKYCGQSQLSPDPKDVEITRLKKQVERWRSENEKTLRQWQKENNDG